MGTMAKKRNEGVTKLMRTGTHIVRRSRKSLVVRNVFHLQRMVKPEQGTMKAFPRLLRAAIHIVLRPRTPLIVRDVFHLQRMAKPEQGTMKAFPRLLRAAIHIVLRPRTPLIVRELKNEKEHLSASLRKGPIHC